MDYNIAVVHKYPAGIAVAFHMDRIAGGLKGDAVFVHAGQAGVGALLDIGYAAILLLFTDIIQFLHHIVHHFGILCEVSVQVQFFAVETQFRIKGRDGHKE